MRLSKTLSLIVMPERMAICHLPPNDYLPTTLGRAQFLSVTRTDEGYSIVLPEESVPTDWKAERGWRGLKVQGPLDFDLTGVLASLAAPLAEASVSIFAISTYNTDYILVKENDLEKAKQALRASGHTLK